MTGMSSKIAIAAILLLPDAGQHDEGADLGPRILDRAHALVRGERAGDLPAGATADSLPYVFSGLKVATVLAMIGAIVGDYFGSAPGALGVEIRRWVGIFAFDQAWAGIVLARRARDPLLRLGRARGAVRDGMASLCAGRRGG